MAIIYGLLESRFAGDVVNERTLINIGKYVLTSFVNLISGCIKSEIVPLEIKLLKILIIKFLICKLINVNARHIIILFILLTKTRISLGKTVFDISCAKRIKTMRYCIIYVAIHTYYHFTCRLIIKY